MFVCLVSIVICVCVCACVSVYDTVFSELY
jgi:hypothetical protein